MTTASQPETLAVALKKEIMLQINQALFDKGVIPKNVFDQAKIKIVNGT